MMAEAERASAAVPAPVPAREDIEADETMNADDAEQGEEERPKENDDEVQG